MSELDSSPETDIDGDVDESRWSRRALDDMALDSSRSVGSPGQFSALAKRAGRLAPRRTAGGSDETLNVVEPDYSGPVSPGIDGSGRSGPDFDKIQSVAGRAKDLVASLSHRDTPAPEVVVPPEGSDAQPPTFTERGDHDEGGEPVPAANADVVVQDGGDPSPEVPEVLSAGVEPRPETVGDAPHFAVDSVDDPDEDPWPSFSMIVPSVPPTPESIERTAREVEKVGEDADEPPQSGPELLGAGDSALPEDLAVADADNSADSALAEPVGEVPDDAAREDAVDLSALAVPVPTADEHPADIHVTDSESLGSSQVAENVAVHYPAEELAFLEQLNSVERQDQRPQPNRRGLALLMTAGVLAVLCGLLAALWLRERSVSEDLRLQIAEGAQADGSGSVDVASLNDEVRTLELQNAQLQEQLSDMSALVLELPEGRVTEISVPFTPIFADEENGRLIAIGEGGEYIIWGEGADGQITDSGTVSGTPTGLFAATRKAWVSTDAGFIDVLSMVAGEPGLPSVEFGPTQFMAAEERGYWTYSETTSEVVRLRKSDGGITDSISVPVPIVDLTIGAGSVWALGDDGRVYRINTADLTMQPIDAGENLIAVTAGPDALWTLSAADGSLRRIDPVAGEVLVTVPVGRDPIDATFAGSSVWVALRSGSSLIEVDTRTSAVVSRTTLPSRPTALHQGDSGVFVTTDGETPLLGVASSASAETDLPDGAITEGESEAGETDGE